MKDREEDRGNDDHAAGFLSVNDSVNIRGHNLQSIKHEEIALLSHQGTAPAAGHLWHAICLESVFLSSWSIYNPTYR